MTTTGLDVEAFLAGDWPEGAELVEGEVIVNDPTFRHQEIVARILYALRTWTLARSDRGLAGVGGNWVITPANAFKPDVWWVSEDRRPDPSSARSDSAANMVVEVRSPGTWRFDIGPKRSAYERAGAGELWLVDTPARTVLVSRRSAPGASEFDVVLEVGPGEVLTGPQLEGFELGIDELFA